MKGINLNTNQERAFFKQLKDKYKGATISPSYLRVAVLTRNANGQYQFNLRKDVGTSLAHDKKLDQNDSFAATRWGIALMKENPAEPGTGRLQTYPNNTVFAAEAGKVTPGHLETFYNGSLRYTKDQKVVVEGWPTRLSSVVRTTQQASPATFSEMEGADGTVLLPTLITFNGKAKNDMVLDIPSWATQQVQYEAAAERIYVVFLCYGFLVTGIGEIDMSDQQA